MQLSEEQLAIVNSPEKHISIQAVAGSGKTTTIMARLQKLIMENKIDNILFVSFSNAAKDAVNVKIQNTIIDENHYDSFTFDKFYFDTLKARHSKLKITLNGEVGIMLGKKNPNYKTIINKVKRNLDFTRIPGEQINIALLEDMKNNPGVYQGAFNPLYPYDTIIVDEAADTSIQQLLVLKRLIDLSNKDFHIIIAGDENQMISDFRGVPNISMQVMTSLLHNTSYHLQTNFRSTERIISDANALLKVMESNAITKLMQRTPDGESYTKFTETLLRLDCDGAVQQVIAPMVANAIEKNESLAVICRSNNTIQKLDYSLHKHGMKLNAKVSQKNSLMPVMTAIAEYYRDHEDENDKSIQEILKYHDHNSLITLFNKSDYNEKYGNIINKSQFIDYMINFDIRMSLSRDDASNEFKDMLMCTIHGSKGLEFDDVILLTNGGFNNMDEAERLLYVGMTRAKKRLVLVHIPSQNDENNLMVLKINELSNPRNDPWNN